MRRLGDLALKILVLTVILSAMGIWGAGRARAEVAEPRIEATPMTFDFGKIDEGVKSKAVYTLKNTGTSELVIFDVKPTCGCTVANLSSKKVAPGETATLEAVYNSQNASGPVRRFINIQTNDPKTPTFTLGIAANVISKPAPEINFSMYNVTNLQLATGGSATRSITVTNIGQLDLVITEVTTSQGAAASLDTISAPPGQTTKGSIVLKPGESRKLDITISPKVRSGNFQEVVTVRSNAKRRPAAVFIAQGIVQG
jgi:hypothetical protein